MNSSDNKLVVNPRDELIQEITVLRQKNELRKLEAERIAKLEHDKRQVSYKKEGYEWSFAELAKRYFKLEQEDLKSLNSDKLERLENLIYEQAKRKFRRLKLLLSVIPICGWMLLFIMFDQSSLSISSRDFPLVKFCKLHQWYKENFGSVAKAISYKV